MRAPVLLVGSVPLENATEVFEATCASVGDLVSRFPDAETGRRTNWIAWQRKAFQALPLLEPTNIASLFIKKLRQHLSTISDQMKLIDSIRRFILFFKIIYLE